MRPHGLIFFEVLAHLETIVFQQWTRPFFDERDETFYEPLRITLKYHISRDFAFAHF